MDYFLSLSRNATTRSLVKSLGLPVSLPAVLRRPSGARARRLLNDARVVVGGMEVGAAMHSVAATLAPMGARVVWTGAAESLPVFQPAAEAWAEPATHWPLDGVEHSEEAVQSGVGPVFGLLFDATSVRTRADLEGLFKFFSNTLSMLSAGGRVVVLAHPPDTVDRVEQAWQRRAEVAGIWQALEGFVRSLAKELGRKGSTANLLWVEPGAEERLPGPLRFLLSSYSAFVTAQPLRVSQLARQTAFEFDGPLLGKTALVTGAARGIGKATAQALWAEGAKVIVLDHPSVAQEASVLAREFSTTPLLQDMAAPDAAGNVSNWLEREYDAVDIVVHNAGITRDKTLARMKPEAWDSVLDVNFFAAVRLTDELLSNKLVRDEGRIIALSSVGGIAGNIGQTNYAASKAGLIGWTRVMANGLAERGITVNAVAPGLIETQMTARMPAMVREAARRLSALNQGGLPEDVAQAVTFLALPENSGVSGNVLRVCGGALMGA